MPGKDRIPFVLGVGAIVVTTLGVGTCSTNARIDDLNADVNRRFDDVRADIRGLRASSTRWSPFSGCPAIPLP